MRLLIGKQVTKQNHFELVMSLRFIFTCLFLTLLLFVQTLPAAEQPPNIIIILADDLGYGDIGTYGAKLIRTPNIDQMAREGMYFSNFYASANVCTPSRASLLTGRYAIRMGLANKTIEEEDDRGLPVNEVTVAEELKKNGYSTAIIGKWHLGHASDDFWPTNHGFDYYYGLLHHNEIEQPLYRNHTIIEEHPVNQKTLTKRYTEETLAFIRENKSKPIFVYLSHTFPHIPLHASEQFENKSKAGRYGDTVEELDWSTGQVLNELKELGIDNHTLVIFTSDNGPFPEGSTGGLRGGKGTPWDGGFRVPFIARWPGKIQPGSHSEQTICLTDLMATCAAIVGADLSNDAAEDSYDFLPVLLGTAGTKSLRQYTLHQTMSLALAIRSGSWKYLDHKGSGGNNYSRDGRWGMKTYALPERAPDAPGQLYRLDEDPGESTNLYFEHPEIVKELKAKLEEFKVSGRSAPVRVGASDR